MICKIVRYLGAFALFALLAGPVAAEPMDELTLIAPAAPGGGFGASHALTADWPLRPADSTL